MPAPDSTRPTADDVGSRLTRTELRVLGRMPWSSNATLLCDLVDGPADPRDGDARDGDAPDEDGPGAHPIGDGEDDRPVVGRAIYKPHRGEQPLWDFPDGLYRREVAAYRLARALGWDLVPPTVERDGPFGVGSVQWFVDADFDRHYFTLLEEPEHHPQLRRLAAFDLVANSTDRKGGHVLRDDDGHLWGIDNGLCLHAEFKVRTVIWDFAGEPLPAELADDLDRFVCRPLPPDLAELLDPFERDALLTRARGLLAHGRFPTDPSGRAFPWPLV